jgi:hypothetical protein
VGVSESTQLYEDNSLKFSGLTLETVSFRIEGRGTLAILGPVFLRRKAEGVEELANCNRDVDMVLGGQFSKKDKQVDI